MTSICSQDSMFECPICLATMVLPVTLTCGHSFCQPCIKSKNFRFVKNVCPVCREKITVRINIFSINVVLHQHLVNVFGSNKSYYDRLAVTSRARYPEGWRRYEDIKKWLKEKAPWIIIVILLYHLLRVKINVYHFSMEDYKAKALDIANSIKGENSLDFKFLLFSQFLRILFSNIIIP